MKLLILIFTCIIIYSTAKADSVDYYIKDDFSHLDSLYLEKNGLEVRSLIIFSERKLPKFDLIPFDKLINVEFFYINYHLSNDNWNTIFLNLRNIKILKCFTKDVVSESIFKQNKIEKLFIISTYKDLKISKNISNLENLNSLDIIVYNGSLIFDSIDKLNQIKTLILYTKKTIYGLDNVLKSINKNSIEEIDIDCDNKIINDSLFSGFSKLKSLNIYMTNLTDFSSLLTSILSLKKLKSLILSVEEICFDVGLSNDFNQLKEVGIYGKISNKDINDFLLLFSDSNLLEEFRIGSSEITIIPESIAILQNLTYLKVSCRKIIELPNSICTLKSLKEIEICKSKKRFRKSLAYNTIKSKMKWCEFDEFCHVETQCL